MIWRSLIIWLFGISIGHAFSWQDLWATKNQQAQLLMVKGDYTRAKNTFLRPDWQAAAAYRAGDYEKASQLYQTLNTENSYYNQGNALAHMGKYEEAIQAYDKTLSINPTHQDALQNRKILEELLKKQKEQQQENNKSKQDQSKQDQSKQDQSKQDQNKQDQNKQDQNKQDQNKQDQNKQDQNKQDQSKQDQKNTEAELATEREKQQTKLQSLQLVPDDPGGLLREKFMRDHLRRQLGWPQ